MNNERKDFDFGFWIRMNWLNVMGLHETSHILFEGRYIREKAAK